MTDLPPPTERSDKLRPDQAVRLLLAKSAELEHFVLGQGHATMGTIAGLAADVALIADLLATHIEASMPSGDSSLDRTIRRLENEGTITGRFTSPEPSIASIDHLAWVMQKMPAEAAQALATFTQVNPQMRGAGWDDCLAILMDADANLEVTEPLFDLMEGTNYAPRLVSAVALTLFYATKAFSDMSHEQRATAVRATLDNNGPLVR